MSVLNNSLLLGAPAGAGGYSISRSLRFNAPDSAFLSRTPASAGNRKTWTWAGWVKRSGLGVRYGLFNAFAASPLDSTALEFDANNKLWFYNYTTGFNFQLVTTPVYRDPSAWLHICLAVDVTQSTASNRVKLYVNGTQVTVFDTASYPANQDWNINSTNTHYIGGGYDNQYYASLYLADIHFIDGQALDPTSFGEFSATTGVWVPKAYTGTYGTNGFRLTFADNSAATATTLGKDAAGSNNWTPNNLSVTAGAGNDSLVDVPVNGSEVDTGSGGQVRGNYCTLNPLSGSSNGILANGNLDYSSTVNSTHRYGTIGVSSGKWYWETTLTSTPSGTSNLYGPGISDNPLESGATFAGIRIYLHHNGNKFNGATLTESAYGASFTNGDVIGVALDLDAGTLVFYKNGVSQGTAFSGLTGTWFPVIRTDATASGAWNFGQRPFAYTAPSGFKALCTANLPAPTIVNPSTVFDTKLYTSNAGTLTVSGLGFSPDFAWLKSRGTGVAHALYDTVRGAGRALKSNTTEAEQFTTDGFVSFNSDGFTLGANTSSPQPDINYTNNVARVAWVWDAGSSTVTNTAGSISSQVRANASAGFSVVTWTYGNAPTVGHGLGVAPSLIIAKSRTVGTDWVVYHRSLGKDKLLVLNGTDAAITSSNYWGSSEPSSTVFGTIGNNTNSNNRGDMVAYCWAPLVGYSSMGSYVGNGSSDGVFVYNGFRPKLILIKRTDSSGQWTMYDTARDSSNVSKTPLAPNESTAESGFTSGYNLDILSNGFKWRDAGMVNNASGGTYIYFAVAESPFQYARAR